VDNGPAIFGVVYMVVILISAKGIRNWIDNDFYSFNPSQRLRRILYVIDVPKGRIPLGSLVWQYKTFILLAIQTLSLPGIIFVEHHIARAYFLLIMLIAVIMHIVGLVLIIIYMLICRLLAPWWR